MNNTSYQARRDFENAVSPVVGSEFAQQLAGSLNTEAIPAIKAFLSPKQEPAAEPTTDLADEPAEVETEE